MALQTFDALRLISPKTSSLQEIMGKELDNSFNRVRNKYAEPMAQTTLGLNTAQAQEHQAKAQQMWQDIGLLNEVFGRQIGGNMPGQMSNNIYSQVQHNTQPQNNGQMQDGGQANNYTPQISQHEQQSQNGSQFQNGYNQSQTHHPMDLNKLTPPQLEVVRNRLKAGQRHYTTLPGGQTLMADPLLGDQVKQLGDTLQQAAHNQEMGKLNAQEFNKTQDALKSSYAKEPIFRELLEVVNDPNFYKATGPLGSRIRGLTDDKDVNALAGRADTLLGDLVNKSVQQFGSNINQSEYKAMQRIKGSTSDNPHALKAKVMLLYTMDKFDRQIQSQYGRNLGNMDRQSALEQAYANADYSEIRNLTRMYDLAHKVASGSKSSYEDVMGAAQDFANATGTSVDAALEQLGKTYIKGNK